MKPNQEPQARPAGDDVSIARTGVTKTPPAGRQDNRPGQPHAPNAESEHGKPTGGPESADGGPPLTATTTQPGAAQREDQSGR